MNILVTGSAGFIGFHLAKRLLKDGHNVLSIDNLNSYYSPKLKEDRIVMLNTFSRFEILKKDIASRTTVQKMFDYFKPEIVFHMAAQAGVRYSIEHPEKYLDSNIIGFGNILEACRRGNVKHLIYASSSSVYGGNTKTPFSTEDPVDNPISLYAVTKRANELMASCYNHLFSLPTTGLRFFTVFGPWGRPDMAYFKWTDAILNGRQIELYNHGKLKRDFTYIDDIVESLVRIMKKGPQKKPVIFNIGASNPVNLIEFLSCLENLLGKKAMIKMLPMQPGDVYATYADTSSLEKFTGFRPKVPWQKGLHEFVSWHKNYFKNKGSK